MSRHSSDGDGFEGIASILVGYALVLCLIALYLLCRAVVFVMMTGVKYPVKGYFISLAVYAGSWLISGILSYYVSAGFGLLACIGAVQLLIVCAVIRRQYAETFMAEDTDIRRAILHTNWWSDKDVPLAA